ncbi:3742_t:CDS:10, partial [Cetraspora pellucida]
MPDLGHEIEEFQYHTWNVINWKNLENRIIGPEFEAGGWKWRILLFPFGNNNSNKVSIYLDFADPKSAPIGWHCCAQFALILWNPEEPEHYVSYYTRHRFTAEESDWGFESFYDQNKLFHPSDGRTRPLIENNSCNITALVRVVKDPTGVLWRGYIGLGKPKLNTFLNSYIQSLYCINMFRKAVYHISVENEKSISSALQWIFYQLQTSNTPVDTTEFTKFFGWDSFHSLGNLDIKEFSNILRENLENKMKNTKADGTISNLFAGKVKSYIKCVNVDYESIRIEDYYDIQLSVKGCKKLDDSFLDYIQEKTLDGDNKYNTEDYGLQGSVMFESFPPVLYLHLDRFEYDAQNNCMVMINDRYEFPLEIDLQKYLSPDADRSKPDIISDIISDTISNIISDTISNIISDTINYVDNNRYFTLLRPEKNRRWKKFADDRVTLITEKKVLYDNYNYSGIDSMNVYMLLYIRDYDIDEVRSPIMPEDIPIYLPSFFIERRLQEENAMRYRKKEENNLYLQTWVVTEEIFKNHQGFDLVNFDNQYACSEISQFKVLKEDTYGAFKKMVAENFRIPADQIRFWILVSRLNKTIRLDFPIPDSYNDISMDEIRVKLASWCEGLKLYMEVFEKQINGKKWFLSAKEVSRFLVFIKYYDPYTQSLESIGHLYVHEFGKVNDIFPILCKKKNLPPNTPLTLYEEIKPTMIEKMTPKFTFKKSEIQNGDIICFQKTLTQNEIQEHESAGRKHSIPEFYESLSTNIIIHFKSKFGYRDPKPEFNLVLNKKMRYDDVASQVAAHLDTNPLNLRFTTVQLSGKPKNEIDRKTDQLLSEILQFST